MTSQNTDFPQLPAPGVNRRSLLKAGLTGFLGFIPLTFWSSGAKAASKAIFREGAFNIAFRNQHTGESFSGAYRVGHKYLPESFERINRILRDFRTGDVFPIDPRTIDILYMMQQKMGVRQPFEVLSGYRSPKTNTMLRTSTTGVARNSLHLTGQAIDLRLPGIPTRRVRDAAVSLRAGGVGYYPQSDFVHVDTGKVRHW